ncbi:MAG: chorismate mutase [Ferrimonas sp.]
MSTPTQELLSAALLPLRQQISTLDGQLLSLLAQRRQLSLQVVQAKAEHQAPVRDPMREQQLLGQLISHGRQLGLEGQYISRLYQLIFEDSVRRQHAWLQEQQNPNCNQQVRVAYLGAPGSYSHIAAHHYFERRARQVIEVAQSTFDGIFAAVENGEADVAILPVENTSSGAINEVFDLLQHTPLSIIGETTETIAHCLLMPSGREKAAIKTIYAHPQVHTQCSGYLSQYAWHARHCSSSAEAMTLAQQDPNGAAIGCERGGQFYQLQAVEHGLANQQQNESRFLVLAKDPQSVPLNLPAKTTLLIATSQQPGALVDALTVLKTHQLTMTKLVSRPIYGKPWEEMFYLDIAANQASEQMQQALAELAKITRYLKVLGSYPSDVIAPTALSPSLLASEPAPAVTSPSTPIKARYARAQKPNDSHFQLGDHTIGRGLSILGQALGGHTTIAPWLAEFGAHGIVASHGQSQPLPLIRPLTPDAIWDDPHVQAWWLPTNVSAPAQLQRLGQQSKPIFLAWDESRPFAQAQQHILQQAEQILQQGNQQVALVLPPLNQNQWPQLAELAEHTHLPLLLTIDALQSPAQQAKWIQAAAIAGVSGVVLAIGDNGLNEQQYRQLMHALF